MDLQTSITIEEWTTVRTGGEKIHKKLGGKSNEIVIELQGIYADTLNLGQFNIY